MIMPPWTRLESRYHFCITLDIHQILMTCDCQSTISPCSNCFLDSVRLYNAIALFPFSFTTSFWWVLSHDRWCVPMTHLILTLSLTLRLLQNPSRFKVFKRAFIYISCPMSLCSYLLKCISNSDLLLLGGEPCFLQRASASEEKHEYEGQAVCVKILSYINL